MLKGHLPRVTYHQVYCSPYADYRCRVSGSGFQIQNFQVSGAGLLTRLRYLLHLAAPGLRILGLGFRAAGFRFKVYDPSPPPTTNHRHFTIPLECGLPDPTTFTKPDPTSVSSPFQCDLRFQDEGGGFRVFGASRLKVQGACKV